jgi:CheY-like chemotaxis protein
MPVRKTPVKKLAARILMVDDNVHGLTARKTVLEEQGHKVTTVTNASDALLQFTSEAFDLVITDFKMPKMNGPEFIARLRQHRAEVPVILLSGFVDTLGLTEHSTGANALIQKSANEVPHLTRAVTRLLTRRVPRKPATKDGGLPRPKRKIL